MIVNHEEMTDRTLLLVAVCCDLGDDCEFKCDSCELKVKKVCPCRLLSYGWRDAYQRLWEGSDEGDVYVYASSDCFVCGRCQLVDIGCFTSKTRSGMITHLQEHIEAGHHVPECAIKRLREEIETEGDDWKWVEDDD